MRVISLVPSVSETLLDWAVEPVAVTRFCELGDRFPTVGGTKDPSIGKVVALRPDLIVMCDQENRREDYDALTDAGCRIHTVSIRSVADVGPQMGKLAGALGLAPEFGTRCGVDIPGADLPGVDVPGVDVPGVDVPGGGSELRVFMPIWRKPWMTVNADTYGSSMLAAAGYRNVFSAHSDRYPTVTGDEIASMRPDLVLAPSEPYPFTMRQHAELAAFAPVRFVDGRDLFWWGARTPAALRRLTRQE